MANLQTGSNQNKNGFYQLSLGNMDRKKFIKNTGLATLSVTLIRIPDVLAESPAPLRDVERLKITNDIRDVMARFERYMNLRQWRLFSSLFADNGTGKFCQADAKAVSDLHGREAIETFVAAITKEETRILHLFSYEILIESRQRVQAFYSMEELEFGVQGSSGKSSGGSGKYSVVLVNQEGRWQISELVQTQV